MNAIDFYGGHVMAELREVESGDYEKHIKLTGCWKCEREMKDYYLNEYMIEIQSPDQKIFEVKIEGLCSNCLQKLVKTILEFTHKL